ncbi:MAG: AAA family ATPase [Actinobacteria bacterium]|nr:AAA family ATPase [Actinomycetota bacterium]
MKGFKSFSDSTTLKLEPGITAVVGPNGSGKSNIVDALAWVLGAQGPSMVRSGKMDDVIFSGSLKHAPLGRAEVSITIDNSSYRLPIDLAEVTITRTLFRSGESEYSLNGVECRLLDIQELLSDSRVGRTQHIIVGQGQLEAVLNASAQERREIIEEAAGVLKYRKRQLRALKRIEATDANLERLFDLLREIRRQLRPLEHQAGVAQTHLLLKAELTSISVYLLGQELKEIREHVINTEKRRAILKTREEGLTQTLFDLETEINEVTSDLSGEDGLEPAREPGPDMVDGSELAKDITDLNRLIERAKGFLTLMAAKLRLFKEELDSLEGSGETDLFNLELDNLRQEMTAKLEFQKTEVKRQISWHQEMIKRGAAKIEALEQQEKELGEEEVSLEVKIHEMEKNIAVATSDQLQISSKVVELEETLLFLESAFHAAEEKKHRLGAQIATVKASISQLQAPLEVLKSHQGFVGQMLNLVEVDEGWEIPFQTLVAKLAYGAVFNDVSQGRAAMEILQQGGFRGTVLVLDPKEATLGPDNQSINSSPDRGYSADPNSPQLVRDHVRPLHPGIELLIDQLLDGAFGLDASWQQALDFYLDSPGSTVVTMDGDIFSPRGWSTKSVDYAEAQGSLEGSLKKLELQVTQAAEKVEQFNDSIQKVRNDLAKARTQYDRTSKALNADEVRLETLPREIERLKSGRDLLLRQIQEERSHLEEVVSRLDIDQERLLKLSKKSPEDMDSLDKSELNTELTAARARARQKVSQRCEILKNNIDIINRIEAVTKRCLDRLNEALVEAERLDRHNKAQAKLRLQHLDLLHKRRNQTSTEMTQVAQEIAQEEVKLTELRLGEQLLTETLRKDFSCSPEAALKAPVPDLKPGANTQTEPALLERKEALEKELSLMGPVNPLALEELNSLKERYEFLENQIADLKSAKQSLLKLTKEIDKEMEELLRAAFTDVHDNFEQLFMTLFPHGNGRFVLTDSAHPLETGIEIEARTHGRNIRRLSLLSGGERSLVAMAFLFAIFRSRPSPFYFLDEVEAALDDINLSRFLNLLDAFRTQAQLVVVTHQKRTIETADVIYGVTMEPGGSSKVVSQRSDVIAKAVSSA